MNERLTRFTDLMRSIFELDKSDLDFGIYRIINIRKNKIEDFLTIDLPRKVQETLKPFAQDDAGVSQRMKEIEDTARAAGIQVSDSPVWSAEYETLKKKKVAGTDLSALETDVYSALYSFFNRYYDEGDFISKRRYKEGVYAIPYEGEEVKLYWANHDQYYIKTSENFKDYTFVEQDISVHFRLVDASTEKDNIKEADDSKRVFMLFTEDEENYPGIRTFEYDQEERELIIRFVFDIPEDKKRKYVEENYAAIKDKIVKKYDALITPLLKNVSKDPQKPKTVLQRHLEAYAAKNTFDYFIHKDLGGFLRRELDFYIKNEVMHLDDLDTENEQRVETWLAKVRAIKRVGHIIIDFLAQLEDFQKKLWLKKKFVVETNWCITLDRIDQSFWAEIAENQQQVQEWMDLYAIQEAEGWSNPPSLEFLKDNQNLLVDTKHFTEVFKDRLLATYDNIDAQTDGLLIHSENFQALKLMQERFRGTLSCIYADPPYNAKTSEILYKNSFKHSSWLSLMYDRLFLSSSLRKEKAPLIVAIDDNEAANLLKLIRQVFPTWNIDCISIIHNPAGIQGDNFSYSHEYAIYTYTPEKRVVGKTNRDKDSLEAFRDWGGTSARTLAKNCFYPIFVENDEIIGFGDVCPDNYHPNSSNIVKGNVTEVYPISDDGEERKWVFARDTVESIWDNLYVRNRNGVLSIVRIKKQTSYKTVWTDKKYYANIHGSKLLNNIMGGKVFDFPKSLYTVQDCLFASNNVRKKDATILDYFAGSGTTGHAVINLNRQDNGKRKYIMVEMGHHFNAVTKPRMQKVIYSDDWKDGKPQNRNTGVSHLMKYIRLESYEDALNNIRLDTDKGDFLSNLFGEEYLVHYLFDTETSDSLLDIQAFHNPFQYQMKITENNEAKLRPVDVVETFNYLIGLSVTHQSTVDHFHASPEQNGAYESSVRLSRDDGGQYAFQQVEGTLPDGHCALVIWRTVTDDLIRSNAVLDAYFTRYCINLKKDGKYDVIFVNGDNNLENIRGENEQWKVVMTELEFKARMFEGDTL